MIFWSILGWILLIGSGIFIFLYLLGVLIENFAKLLEFIFSKEGFCTIVFFIVLGIIINFLSKLNIPIEIWLPIYITLFFLLVFIGALFSIETSVRD